MEIIAKGKSIRMGPRKIRLIADLIRQKKALDAVDVLSLIQKRAAYSMQKILKSAIANAEHNAKLNKENLIIKTVEIGEGTAFKRFHPSTRGRTHPYKKRSSNIRIILEEKERRENGPKD